MRVNLEARFFSSARLDKFQELMGWNRAQAIGTLAMIWHESQSEERIFGTANEIADWARVREDIPRLIMALEASKFIRKTEDENYTICGNADQLEWLEKRRAAAAKGGQANKIRLLESHMASQRIAKGEPKQATMQGNAIQCSSKNSITIPKLDLASAWNTSCPPLPKVSKINTGRQRKIKARLAEEPDLTYWQRAIARMAASTFCREGSWATFDWLIANDNNHVKVMEGKFDNRDENRSSQDLIALLKEADAKEGRK